MCEGARSIIFFASEPMARIWPVRLLIATKVGSFTTIPLEKSSIFISMLAQRAIGMKRFYRSTRILPFLFSHRVGDTELSPLFLLLSWLHRLCLHTRRLG